MFSNINYYDEVHSSFFILNKVFKKEYDNWDKKDTKGFFTLGNSFSIKILISKLDIVSIKNKYLLDDYFIKKIQHLVKYPKVIYKIKNTSNFIIFGVINNGNNKRNLIGIKLQLDKGIIYNVKSIYFKDNLYLIKKHVLVNVFIDNKVKSDCLFQNLFLLTTNNDLNKYVMIKDIPINERPRERAIKYGIDSLSNEELLSIIIRTGTHDMSVKTLSNKILSLSENINDLRNLTIETLMKVKGIGKVKAIELLSSIELGKRVFKKTINDKVKLNNSKKIYNYFKDLVIDEKQENFYAIYLDTKSYLISYKLLFKGTINASCVHPREIFKYAVLNSAYSIIVFHNHPSGNPYPSIQDKEITTSLFEIGKVMAIPVVDHIIFGEDTYFSFYEYFNSNDNNI